MENNIISENQVKEVLHRLLNEQTSKVSRQEFNRVQFKMDELHNSLNETIKELRKLEDSIPSGLKTVTNGRINGISNGLSNSQKLLMQVKEKVRQFKKTTLSQHIEEKKK
jgi:esterase/lipase